MTTVTIFPACRGPSLMNWPLIMKRPLACTLRWAQDRRSEQGRRRSWRPPRSEPCRSAPDGRPERDRATSPSERCRRWCVHEVSVETEGDRAAGEGEYRPGRGAPAGPGADLVAMDLAVDLDGFAGGENGRAAAGPGQGRGFRLGTGRTGSVARRSGRRDPPAAARDGTVVTRCPSRRKWTLRSFAQTVSVRPASAWWMPTRCLPVSRAISPLGGTRTSNSIAVPCGGRTAHRRPQRTTPARRRPVRDAGHHHGRQHGDGRD